MSRLKIHQKYFLGVLIIAFMVCLSSSVNAQFPYFNPLGPYGGFYYGYNLFSPAIRTASFFPGYAPPFMPPVYAPPAPVIRTAAATITLWNTVGTASALIIYNPTSLIGASAAPVTPSPLFSLLAGLLTAPFGHSALSTSNPAFYNYLVNTYLLPTGLSTFLF